MKKEANGKKSLAWLWILIAIIAVLAIAGGVFAAIFFLGNTGEEEVVEPEKIMSDLYWNLDRKEMVDPETGLSAREAAADGMYYLRLAVNGEQVEIPVADKKLVNRMDILDVFGLQFDAEGNVVDMIAPEDMYVKIGEKVFVQDISGNVVTLNTSQALNGMQIRVTLDGTEGVYNLSTLDRPEYDGIADELEIMDQVLVYGKDEETAHTIYIMDRFWKSDVYWRMEQKYDSTNKCTTRPQNEDGFWYFDMSVNGKVVNLRTNDITVINAIDGYGVNACYCGLVFNDEGDVIDCFNAAMAARGSLVSSGYDVTSISEDGKTFTTTRITSGNEVGKTYTGTIGPDTKIFNVNTSSEVIGEVAELQLNDRVQILADTKGNPKYIYIINRMVDSPMYYNINRNFTSAAGKSTRVPNADGWYEILFAVKGKQVTYKTKDWDLVNKIDSLGYQLMGLKVKNGIILDVYEPHNVSGNYSFAANYFVVNYADPLLSAASSSGASANGVLAEGCEIYDVSGVNRVKGKKATLREGDRIVCYTNAVGEITHIYITARYVAGTTLYWNINSRSYDGKKYETKATPNEEGYYTFKVIKAGGKEVELKSKDKEVANQFHALATNAPIALKVSGDTLKGAYPGWSCVKGGGYYSLANTTLTEKTEDGGYKALTTTFIYGTLRQDAACKVYNVAAKSLVKSHRGEKTTLKLGDRVYPIYNNKGVAEHIFVTVREADCKVYFKYDRKYNSTTQETTRVPNEDGYYVFKMTQDGKVKEYKTKDKDIATAADSYALAIGMKVSGDIIKAVYPPESAADIYGGGYSYYDVTKISGNTVTVKRNKPGQSDTGKTGEFEMASNVKIINVSATADEKWGTKDKLSRGDRIYNYKDNMGKTSYVFIMNECTRSDGGYAKCSHCGKTVWWEPATAGYSVVAGYTPNDAHYYLEDDRGRNSWLSFNASGNTTDKKGTTIVLDFYGHTWTRIGTESFDAETGLSKGFFASSGLIQVGSGNTLILTNSSSKQGGLVAGEGVQFSSSTVLLLVSADSASTEDYDETATIILEKGLIDASKGISTYTGANSGAISVGGNLIVKGGEVIGPKSISTNTTATAGAIGTWGGSNVTISGGIVRGCPSTAEDDYVGAAGAAIAANSSEGLIKITGGEIFGSNVRNTASAIYNRNGDMIISGGKIHGGVVVASGKTVKISGNPVITSEMDGGLMLMNNSLVEVGKLGNEASIFINGNGVFTTDFATAEEAQAVADTQIFYAKTPAFVFGNALAVGEYRCLNGHTTKEQCEAASCVEELVFWSEWTSTDSLPASGNYYLAGDVTVESSTAVEGSLVLDLKGHTITRNVLKANDPNVYTVYKEYNLRLTDTAEVPGKIVSEPAEGVGAITTSSGIMQSSSPTTDKDTKEILVEGGDITIDRITVDGSKLTSDYTGANSGVVVSGGVLTVNNAKIYGYTTTKGQGTAIGSWGSSEIIINGTETEVVGGNNLANQGGVISANGKLVINGGTFKTYEGTEAARHGAIIGMGNGDLVINGGTFYGNTTTYNGAVINHGSRAATINGGTFYAAKASQGGIIYGSGTLVITGGEFIGVGADETQATGNGGLVYNNGKSATITGGTFKDGNATGWGRNIAYTNTNGCLTIGGDAKIAGEVRVYMPDSATTTTNLVLTGKAAIDYTLGTVSQNRNLMLSDTVVYLNDMTGTPIATVGKSAVLYDLVHDAEGNITGITTSGGVTPPEPAADEWTNATALPTEGNIKLMTDVTVTDRTVMTGNLTIDLNGFNITRNVAAGATKDEEVFYTGAFHLTIKDTNEEKEGIISAVHGDAADVVDSYAGIIYVNPTGGMLTVEGGIIDGSNLVQKNLGAHSGVIMAGNNTTVEIKGGVVKGLLKKGATSSSAGGSAIAGWGSSNIIISGGEVIAYQAAENEYATASGGAIATGGHVTITGGKLVGGRVAARGATIACANNSGKLTISGGEILGGYAKLTGGNILWQGTGGVEITGGHIAAGTCAQQGATAHFAKSGMAVKISGNAMIEGGIYANSGTDLYLDGKAVIMALDSTIPEIELASADAFIGLTSTTPAVAHTNASAPTSYTVIYNAEGTITGIQAADAAWPQWTDATSLPANGTYQLATDVTLAAPHYFTNAHLDLNGHTITRNVAAGVTKDVFAIGVAKGGTTILTDSSATPGTITSNFAGEAKTTSSIGMIHVVETTDEGVESTLVLENITVDGSQIECTYTAAAAGVVANGSNLYVNNATIKGFKKTAGGKGTAIGGWGRSNTVINGEKTLLLGGGGAGNGGVLYTTGKLTINDGTYKLYDDATACTYGSILGSNASATIVINGGTFHGAKANSAGGVMATDAAPVTITGGTFYAAPLADSGNGGICSGTGTLTITGGEFIGTGATSGTKASGGLIANYGPALTITGGNFHDGMATGYGCNIYYNKIGGVFTIGGDAIIAGEIRVHVTDGNYANLVLADKAVVDYTLATTSWNRNLMLSNTKVFIGEMTGEPVATVGSSTAYYNVVKDADGNITGIATA